MIKCQSSINISRQSEIINVYPTQYKKAISGMNSPQWDSIADPSHLSWNGSPGDYGKHTGQALLYQIMCFFYMQKYMVIENKYHTSLRRRQSRSARDTENIW